jgi:hypothetical protein
MPMQNGSVAGLQKKHKTESNQHPGEQPESRYQCKVTAGRGSKLITRQTQIGRRERQPEPRHQYSVAARNGFE